MFARFKRLVVTASLLFTASFMVETANAQQVVQPPTVTATDQNGVNLATGKYQLPDINVSIGTGESGIARIANENSDNHSGKFEFQYYQTPGSNGNLGTHSLIGKASYGGKVYKFTMSHVAVPLNSPVMKAGPYISLDGTTPLECNTQYYESSSLCSFYTDNGDKVTYTNSYVDNIIKANGEVVTLKYYSNNALKTVSSSLGWMLKYEVDANSNLMKVVALNSSIDYCDPNANSCIVSSEANVSTKNTVGNTTTLNNNGLNLSSYTKSGTSLIVQDVNTKTINLTAADATGTVSSFSVAGSTWNYTKTTPTGTFNEKTYTVSGPNSTIISVKSDDFGVISTTDELNRINLKDYNRLDDPFSTKLYKSINPDGNSSTGGFAKYTYDARGNVTKVEIVPKGGAINGFANAGAAIVTSATYAASCDASNIKWCNKPLSYTDENGITTTYTYDSAHGGLLTETKPAVNGAQAQTRYSYGLFTPYIKNSGGGMTAQGQVYRLVGTSSCMTTNLNACVGGTDEAKTTISYAGYNLLPSANTISRGDGSLAQTTTYEYNYRGQVTAVDGPKPGTMDKVYTFYDAYGRNIGTIGADPDGAGPRPRPVTRTTYDNYNRVTMEEEGTTAGTSLADLQNMTVVSKDTNEFDANTGLATIAKHYDNGTLTALTQKSYDNLFRTDCVAQRLNPAVYGTIASTSACTLGTAGANGHDRIVKYNYDNANQVLSTISAFGTSDARSDFVKTFNASNGTLSTIADAKGNKTTYHYDNFNRAYRTCYPTPSNGVVSSTTDCEQSNFANVVINGVTQAGSRLASVNLRDGQTINFGYDAMGRLNSKSGAVTETISRNNFGLITARTNNGQNQYYGYNSLGWVISDTQPLGTINYEYDTYGKRTRMWWPGNTFSVTYNYNDYDELTSINENGGPALVWYDYDNLGRRAYIARQNAHNTTYSYDNSSRLSSITQGSANTQTLTYTNAWQLNSRTNSNASFNSPLTQAIETYGIDGLNRVNLINALSTGYDARGNMTSDGVNAYSYNAKNQMVTGAGASIIYDAEDRLLAITKAGVTTKFLYDGTDIIAEFDASNNLLRKYVHGEGTDEPLVWYEGSNKYFLHADSQGSITSTTDGNGTVINISTYDAYGKRTASNDNYSSRFSYTGQAYLKEISLYYYKARIYNQNLGRFMQTDPIGYGDGMNWYNYVGSDPVNGSDPSGLATRFSSLGGGCFDIANSYSRYGGTTKSPDGKSETVTYLGGWIHNTVCIPSGGDLINVMGDGFQNAAQAAQSWATPSDPAQCSANQANGIATGALAGGAGGYAIAGFANIISAVPSGGGTLAALPVSTSAGATVGATVGGYVGGAAGYFSDSCHNGGNAHKQDASGGSEHTKGKRKSTKFKHEAGQARKGRDRGGEDGDVRRRDNRKRPPGFKGPWPRRDR